MILASSSQRRRVLLSLLLDQFSVVVPDVDETLTKPYEASLKRVAERKRDAVAGDVVLAADTIGLSDALLLKPASEVEARSMLESMNNNSHEVLTAVAVTGQPTKIVRTRVEMAIPPTILEEYLASGQWEGKAGAYGIQDPMIAPHITIDGPWSNVVGLPLTTTHEMLQSAGISSRQPPEESYLADHNPFQLN